MNLKYDLELHLTYDREENFEAKYLAKLLHSYGIECELDKGKMTIRIDAYRAHVSKTRRAGRKEKEIICTVDEIRKRLESESVTNVAKSLGIDRSTLYRRLKKAEEKGSRYI